MALPLQAWGPLMREYRIYVVNQDNNVDGPPAIVSCDNDELAVQKACYFVHGRDVELREGTRLVTRLRCGTR